MPTLSAGSTATDIVQPGQALTVTCAADATASVVEVGAPGAAPGTPTAVAAGAAYLVQASTTPRYFRISAAGGSVSYTVATVPAGVSQGFSNTGSLPASGTVLDLESDQVTCDAVLTRYGASVGAAYIGRSARGTKAAPTASTAGDLLCVFGGRGRGATGWISGSKASMRVRVADTWTDSSTPTQLQFATTPTNSTTSLVRFTITEAGFLSVTDIAQVPECADDTAAAAAGVPVGGFYRLSDGNGNATILIRLA